MTARSRRDGVSGAGRRARLRAGAGCAAGDRGTGRSAVTMRCLLQQV